MQISNKQIVNWYNGKFIKKKEISAYNYALHYGSPCVWEGIRAYKQSSRDIKILELEMHIKRLFQSAKLMRLKVEYSETEISSACRELVKRNGDGDQYIRPMVFPEVDADNILGAEFPSASIYIFSTPMQTNWPPRPFHLGWAPEPRGYPEHRMQIKTPSNYLQSADSLVRSGNSEFDDFLVKTKHGYVSETTVANIFIYKNGMLLTPPNDGNILPGITRQRVSEIVNSTEFKKLLLKQNMQLPFIAEKQLTTVDVQSADEMFMCGTYAEIIPVTKVDHIDIGDGKMGKLTKMIMETYQDKVRGIKTPSPLKLF